jgi:mannose-1-phosphate guanylyltransferase
MIRAALPRFTDSQILGEPVGRDTVNAVGFAAAVLAKRDPQAVFAVLTADHLIEPADLFRDRMEQGFELVEKDPGRLVTFSIAPTYPATGFGYVERGAPIPGTNNLAFRVERFVEKPSAEKAQAYIESGAFGWNSGMFVWNAATFLDCLRRYKPESYEGLTKIASAWGTPQQKQVLEAVYPTLPKISVDYAVMEPATREQARTTGRPAPASGPGVKVCTVLMDLTWLDVGSWPSFGQTVNPDAQGNRVSGNAKVSRSKDTLVVNADDRHTVAVLGCEGLIVVHTEDATLVMPAARAEELKLLHAELPEKLK